jgi:hypothetical protein
VSEGGPNLISSTKGNASEWPKGDIDLGHTLVTELSQWRIRYLKLSAGGFRCWLAGNSCVVAGRRAPLCRFQLFWANE